MTLGRSVTSVMSKAQMMMISRKFPLYTFAKSSCLAIPTSHPHKMAKMSHIDARGLWVDVTLAMSKVQMMKISRNFP